MAGKITLRGLARELGLHSSTVSRALSGHPAVDPSTARRVNKAARARGYAPNPDVAMAMRAIRRSSGQSLHGIFGVLNFFPDSSDGRRMLADLPQYRGVLERAHQLGWMADTISVHAEGMGWQRVRSILRARNIVGVVLLPPPLGSVPVGNDMEGLHVVTVSSAWVGVPGLESATTVLPAHWRNALMIFDHLRTAGYRRPLLHVHEGIEERHLHATMAAFLYTHHAGYWETKVPVYEGKLRADPARRLIGKYAPDVIVGPDVFVKEFFERDVGIRIPQDCAFMMYSHNVPGAAGLDQHMDIIGQTATELLTGMILHADPPEHTVHRSMHVRGDIVPGPTLPNPKKAASRKSPARRRKS